MIETRFTTEIREIPVKHLRLNDVVNRTVQPRRVKQLILEMNADSLGLFHLWKESEGIMWVIDGQHRKRALEEMGLGDWPARCVIYTDMTESQAAAMFLALNKGLVVKSFDKFRIGVTAGEPDCVGTQTVIESLGLIASGTHQSGAVAAVAAACEVWSIDQGRSLEFALSVALRAWGKNSGAFEGQIIKGLGILSAKFNGQIDTDSFIKKLAKFAGGPPAIIGQAKARQSIKGGTIHAGVAEILIDTYNKGRTAGRLPS